MCINQTGDKNLQLTCYNFMFVINQKVVSRGESHINQECINVTKDKSFLCRLMSANTHTQKSHVHVDTQWRFD